MKLELTPLAERKLHEKIGTAAGKIRLIYDTDGCGCAVNGVPGLEIINETAPDDIAVETEGAIPFYVHDKQQVFFEELMKLDGHESTYAFRLDSRSQSYGTNIRIVDTRN